MQNTVTLSITSGQYVLTFGTYAVRRFCKLTGCSNAPQSILAELSPDKMLDSLVAVIRSGLEATAEKTMLSGGIAQPITEYLACEIADSLTATQSQQLAYAFIGSVLGIPASEVPEALNGLTEPEKSPNAEAPEVNAPAGNDSPSLPTATA